MRCNFYSTLALAALFATESRNTVNAIFVGAEDLLAEAEYAQTLAELKADNEQMNVFDNEEDVLAQADADADADV